MTENEEIKSELRRLVSPKLGRDIDWIFDDSIFSEIIEKGKQRGDTAVQIAKEILGVRGSRNSGTSSRPPTP